MDILAIATFVMAGVAGISILHTHRLQQRESRMRLLDSITEWIVDIKTASFSVNLPGITPVKDSDQNSIKSQHEKNTLFKYVSIYQRKAYVRAIASKVLKRDLQADIENTIKTFAVFLFLYSKYIGVEKPEEFFGGLELEEIGKVKKQITGNEKALKKSFDEYDLELTNITERVLAKVGKIKADLLSSYPKVHLPKVHRHR